MADSSMAAARPAAANDGVRPPQDDKAALLVYHMSKLRSQGKALAELKAKASAEAEAMTDLFRQAKADGGWDRKFLQHLLDASGSSHRDLIEERSQLDWAYGVLGLPLQADLFGGDETPQTSKDEMAWEAEGYLAGRRADEPKPPPECPSMFTSAWMRGYRRGQETNGMLLSRGEEIARQQESPSTEAPKPLNGDAAGEGDETDEDDKVEEQARRLQESGFTDGAPGAKARRRRVH